MGFALHISQAVTNQSTRHFCASSALLMLRDTSSGSCTLLVSLLNFAKPSFIGYYLPVGFQFFFCPYCTEFQFFLTLTLKLADKFLHVSRRTKPSVNTDCLLWGNWAGYRDTKYRLHKSLGCCLHKLLFNSIKLLKNGCKQNFSLTKEMTF